MHYKPEYDGPIAGYVVNFAAKNQWRVERSMEFEEILQEAYIVFLRCRRKYPRMDTPQHFMALFKRAWTNEFTDLANKDTLLRNEVEPQTQQRTEDGRTSFFEEQLVGDCDNEGALATALRQAPVEVKAVLTLFLNAPQELLELAMSSWYSNERLTQYAGNQRVCKLLGLNEGLDVMGMTKEYFSK